MSRMIAALRFAPLWLAALGMGISRAEGASGLSEIEYSTSGTIGTASVAGSPVVQFQGVSDATVALPASFRSGEIPVTIPAGYGSAAALGSFVATTPPADGVTIYKDTPFEIDVRILSIDGQAPASGQGTVVIRGWLDGTLAGSSPSGLTAHYALTGDFGVPYEPRDLVGDVQAGLSTLSLTIPRVTTNLNVPSYQASTTAISAMLVADSPLPSPAPEPGTLLIFLVATAAVALRSRGGRRPG